MERASRESLRLLHNGMRLSGEDPGRGSAPRFVPACNFHLTLAFLGSIAASRVALIHAVATEVSREACPSAELDESAVAARRPEVQFDFERIEYWRKARVLCALTSEDAAPSMQSPAKRLADQLKSRVLAAGFAPDLKPFRAHVTLARKVLPPNAPHRPSSSTAGSRCGNDGLAMSSVTWRFASFALIDSRTGAQGSSYSVLERWPLCTPSA